MDRMALKVNEAIHLAIGFGNTYLVTTPEGNVVIDTSLPEYASWHVPLLKGVSAAPVKYIILTHGHGDHTGGVALWREPGTQVIAQKEHFELVNYHKRLENFFGLRGGAQFAWSRPTIGPGSGNYGAEIQPNIFFDQRYEFSLGGTQFELYHTPGETPDHLTVWVPRYRAAFTGDNYYDSFPNLYTLRGTKPRWPLEYISSITRVLNLKPEILLPSHGRPIYGNSTITACLTRYRDAIQYVHDEVVAGMNAGKDVFELMREIHLPPHLEMGEGYGKVTWSIRGIYEGYAGWFNTNPASMYEVPASAVYPDVVWLAGGPEAVTRLAIDANARGRPVEALHLTEMALAADAMHRPALIVRLNALESLREGCRNSNERGWLDSSIREVEEALASARRFVAAAPVTWRR
jgi:alkyl sulfatase BDS1-like metallo-beta-lactamase superfamily hydrolase